MAAVKPFLTLNLPLLKRGLEAVEDYIENGLDAWEQAVARAMHTWLEDLIAEAAARAPHGTGDLRASGKVAEPTIIPGLIAIRAGFNKIYATIQDQGGEIRPKKAKALFIPLRPGVRPIKGREAQKASGWKYGVDFFLSQLVTLKGNRYFSGVLAERMPKAAEQIGTLAQKFFAEAMASRPKPATGA